MSPDLWDFVPKAGGSLPATEMDVCSREAGTFRLSLPHHTLHPHLRGSEVSLLRSLPPVGRLWTGGGKQGRSHRADLEGWIHCGKGKRCVNTRSELVGSALDQSGEGLLSACTYWPSDPGK